MPDIQQVEQGLQATLLSLLRKMPNVTSVYEEALEVLDGFKRVAAALAFRDVAHESGIVDSARPLRQRGGRHCVRLGTCQGNGPAGRRPKRGGP